MSLILHWTLNVFSVNVKLLWRHIRYWIFVIIIIIEIELIKWNEIKLKFQVERLPKHLDGRRDGWLRSELLEIRFLTMHLSCKFFFTFGQNQWNLTYFEARIRSIEMRIGMFQDTTWEYFKVLNDCFFLGFFVWVVDYMHLEV